MKSGEKSSRKINKNEKGVALVTVVMISVLLLIACIAILSSVASHSRNVTDVLSESKAYYAAESGLQTTINLLRNDLTPSDPNDNVTYIKASTPAESNYTNDPYPNARFSRWLTYNFPTTGTPNRVVIGNAGTYTPNTDVAYSIEIRDPDRTEEYLTFYTVGTFLSGGTVTNTGSTHSIQTSNGTTVTFTDASSTTVNFLNGYQNPSFGTFTTSGALASGTVIEFRIDYKLTAPRTDTRSIYGKIKQEATGTTVTFQSRNFGSVGSQIALLCGQNETPSPTTGCTNVSLTLPGGVSTPFYAHLTRVEPRRLQVISTGYGPNNSRKKLEAIVLRDMFDGLASGAATSLIGASAGMVFQPGTSAGINYSGGNCASSTGCVPSFGLTNPTNLQYVINNPPGPAGGNPDQMLPPPALLDGSNTPEWQQSPAALDALVSQLRTVAQNSPGSYFVNPSGNQENFTVGSNQNPPGSYANGTGITFCEGSCKIGANGGGILVVTGKLTNVGNFHFRGMIIVTGAEGWERNGTGGGEVIGNVVIAPYNQSPYNPQSLSTAFLAPQYYVNGGGVSTITYSDIGATLDGTTGVSNFMLGVAEK